MPISHFPHMDYPQWPRHARWPKKHTAVFNPLEYEPKQKSSPNLGEKKPTCLKFTITYNLYHLPKFQSNSTLHIFYKTAWSHDPLQVQPHPSWRSSSLEFETAEEQGSTNGWVGQQILFALQMSTYTSRTIAQTVHWWQDFARKPASFGNEKDWSHPESEIQKDGISWFLHR